MANFAVYFPRLLQSEGGYCNSSIDPGKETYRGISRTYHPTWSGWAVVDEVKAQHQLTDPVPASAWPELNQVLEADVALGTNIEAFYQALYWDSMLLQEVNSQSIANQVADHGVNAGTNQSIMMLQYLLATEFGKQLAIDGLAGPATIAALNEVDAATFYPWFTEMRRAFYYYRADSLVTTPHMASWVGFLAGKLGVVRDKDMLVYLDSWIGRTEELFSS